MTKRKLPEHLYAAFNWIDTAGEWDEAMSDPRYAADAARNHAEHYPNDTDVTEDLLTEVIEWHRGK